jgi:hypothetical protein
MPTETHPNDARHILSLIAASILIAVVGVLAVSAQLRPWTGSMQGPSVDAVAAEAVAEFGD